MSGTCQDKCSSFKGYHRNGGKTYRDGFVRCTVCNAVFEYEGYWCPCCRNRVRTKSRYKKKLEVTA